MIEMTVAEALEELTQANFHSEHAAISSRIKDLEMALSAFGTFLEPMRFDRKSDDEKAIELDRLYRRLMGV